MTSCLRPDGPRHAKGALRAVTREEERAEMMSRAVWGAVLPSAARFKRFPGRVDAAALAVLPLPSGT